MHWLKRLLALSCSSRALIKFSFICLVVCVFIVAFCINSIFDLDRNLALSRGDVLFHCYGKNIIDRGKFAAFFKGKDNQDKLKQLYLNGKKFYTYSKPKANFIGRFSRRFLVNPVDYEEKKQQGVSESLNQITQGRRNTWMEDLVFKMRYEKGIPIEKIAELSNVSQRTVERILQRVKQRKMLTAL